MDDSKNKLITAILYAKEYRHSSDKLSNAEIKQLVREKSLDKLNEVAQFVTNPSVNTNLELENFLVDVVVGGAVKVKQYLLETDKLPNIRGASILLDDINRKRIPKLVETRHIGECLVYTGGGKIMGIFPQGTGDKICCDIEEIFSKVTLSAECNIECFSISLGSLLKEYYSARQSIDQKLELRQGLRWQLESDSNNGDLRFWSDDPDFQYTDVLKRIEDHELCSHCNQRDAFAIYNEQNLCMSCFNKTFTGGKPSKSLYIDEFRKSFKDIDSRFSKSEIPNELKDIQDNLGYLGIIYGDANNMAAAVKNIKSLISMNMFSQTVEKIVKDSVYSALYEHMTKIQFEIVALGGDDILIIVPGAKAYSIALAIGQAFDKMATADNLQIKESLTMSLGVCITHTHMPIQYSFSMAQQLLKSAKKKAWQIKKGTMDWIVVKNGDVVSSSLHADRKNMNAEVPRHTMRPYTWEQARALKLAVKKQLQNNQSDVFELYQTMLSMSKEEWNLFYQYQNARKKEDREVAVNKSLEALNPFGNAENGKVKIDASLYYPWLDMVEIWDFLKEGKDEEK